MKSIRRGEFSAIALGALSALYNAAVRLTGSDHDAEDLVQETYLHAFEHADQLKSLAACRAWLFRIMRNRFVSQHRAARARPELVLVEGELERLPAAEEAASQLERAALARISCSAIEKALARLPEEMRTAVTMCDIEGFSYHDIAEIVGCPVGTVRSRIARAREQLVRALAAEAEALGISKRRKQ
jgi:RNA polymerase sigma-70 factor, ECF subfamily